MDKKIDDQITQAGWLVIDGQPVNKGGSSDIYRCVHRDFWGNIEDVVQGFATAATQAPLEDVAALAQIIEGSIGQDATPLIAAAKVHREHENRTRQELEKLQKITHPNLVKPLAFDEGKDPVWYIMKFFRRGHLEDHLSTYQGDIRRSITDFLPLVEAVARLHEAGITHRDIKPKNIFVDTDDRLVLADLGIALSPDDERLTLPGNALWSRDWVPDWLVGKDMVEPSPKIDVFMLAKTLYFMVSGKKPRPSQFGRREFDLRQQYPNEDGASELQELLARYLPLHEEDLKAENAKALVEDLAELQASFARPHALVPLFNWISTNANSDVAGMGKLARIRIPPRVRRMEICAQLFGNTGPAAIGVVPDGGGTYRVQIDTKPAARPGVWYMAPLSAPERFVPEGWAEIHFLLGDAVRLSGLSISAV